MITVTQANTNPMAIAVSSILADSCAYPKLSSEILAECCLCSCDCDYIEKAFVFDAAFDNDKSTFLFPKNSPSDTIIIELIKDSKKIAVTAAHGTIYDTSTLYGVEIDWYKVFQLYGYGYYNISSTLTRFGQSVTVTSHKYHVLRWDYCLTNYSVKIESQLRGKINKYLDLGELNIYQSTRVGGYFGKDIPEFESITYQNTNLDYKQIQDKVINNYRLDAHEMPQEIYNYLNVNHFLANEIYITDYNQNNPEKYTKLPVKFDGFLEFSENQKQSSFSYKFKDRTEKFIKI